MKNSIKEYSLPLITLAVAIIFFGIIFIAIQKNSSSDNVVVTTHTKNQIDISQLLKAKIPNFTEVDDKLLTLSNGVYKGKVLEGKASSTISVPFQIGLDTASSSYAYGDVNGDRKIDIAATFFEDNGGSGDFAYLALFVDDEGTPKYVASKSLGDRVNINRVAILNGTIIVDLITQGENDPMCCGTLDKIVSFRLDGNNLVQVSNSN